MSHPWRVHEEVLKLGQAVKDQIGGKANYCSVISDGNPHPSFQNPIVREHKPLGVLQQWPTVALIRKRGSPEDPLKILHVSHVRFTNKDRHRTRFSHVPHQARVPHIAGRGARLRTKFSPSIRLETDEAKMEAEDVNSRFTETYPCKAVCQLLWIDWVKGVVGVTQANRFEVQ